MSKDDKIIIMESEADLMDFKPDPVRNFVYFNLHIENDKTGVLFYQYDDPKKDEIKGYIIWDIHHIHIKKNRIYFMRNNKDKDNNMYILEQIDIF